MVHPCAFIRKLMVSNHSPQTPNDLATPSLTAFNQAQQWVHSSDFDFIPSNKLMVSYFLSLGTGISEPMGALSKLTQQRVLIHEPSETASLHTCTSLRGEDPRCSAESQKPELLPQSLE